MTPTAFSLTQLDALVQQTWPEHGPFHAARYFTWPGAADYLYPHVTPAGAPEGVTTPRELLQALVAKHVLPPASYVLRVTTRDLCGASVPHS